MTILSHVDLRLGLPALTSYLWDVWGAVWCRTIVAEAEEASIGIYGKPMSIKEQQVREPFSPPYVMNPPVSLILRGTQPLCILMSPQDYMWNKATMSVFDLEQLENKAQQVGDMMPWQNDKYDAMLPPGFEEDGSKRIGGGGRKAF